MAQLSSSHAASSSSSSGGLGPRAVAVVFLLAIAAVAAVFFLAAVGAFKLSKLGLNSDVENGVLFAILGNAGRAVAAVLWFVVGVGALWLLTRTSRGAAANARASGSHVLAMDDNGWVVIGGRGVATVAEAAIERVKGVVEAKVSVVGDGASPVQLSIHALIHAGAKQKEAGDELREKAEHAVRELVGLEVTQVGVKIEVIPPEKLSRLIQ
jgi:uncharacterized alkaline shock family protein YloU